jgi:hypothetical protein
MPKPEAATFCQKAPPMCQPQAVCTLPRDANLILFARNEDFFREKVGSFIFFLYLCR